MLFKKLGTEMLKEKLKILKPYFFFFNADTLVVRVRIFSMKAQVCIFPFLLYWKC